jgi:hypothetical protein
MELPIPRERVRLKPRVSLAVLGLILLANGACASDYCSKEQYGRDRALIADAFSRGTLVKGPKSLRDSILIQEGEWYKMNYPQQIAFIQSYECSIGRGKQFLYLDVRSLGTGRLLSTWTLGTLKPVEELREPINPGMSGAKEDENPIGLINPGMSGAMEDENRIGLTGEVRAAFIKYAISECSKVSNSSTVCSCCAGAMADKLTIKELRKAFANGAAGMSALWPKLAAARARCLTN